MKIWISKYALSGGITEHECDPPAEGGIYVRLGGFVWFTLGRDAHTTREEAAKAAEAARVKKIASVRKQLAKLEALSF